MNRTQTIQRTLAIALSLLLPGLPAWPQEMSSIAPQSANVPSIVRPYFAVDVPPVRLANSGRLRELVRAGNLYLTVQDAVALAIENDIDLEVARYNPILAEWNLTRAKAGGALPGVPSNASQAGSVASGQGVLGSQAAAGVKILGTGSNRAQATNATIQQIGPVTQTLDPIVQEASTFSHTTNIEPNSLQSVTPFLVDKTGSHSLSIQQGLLTGGSVTLTYTDHYLDENAPTNLLNPSSAPSLAISFQHNLLQGFGKAVNARTITVMKMNLRTSDLIFETQVVNVVSQVLTAYYNLAAAYEDIKAKRTAAGTARTFLENVNQQVRLGALAPSDSINAQTQVASTERDLVDSDTTVRQQEVQLKNLLSRSGTADPVLAPVRIIPVDRITIPEHEDLPPVEELVKMARSGRTDLATDQQNQASAEVSSLGTKNGVRPVGVVFASESHAGLAGTPHTVTVNGISESPDPYFAGGLGTALGQVFRRNFPTYGVGLAYFAPVRNWQAQADYAIDQLQLRQTQLTTRKDLNQVEVDVQNFVIAVRQARARYQAAVQNRVLQQQLLESEQKRFKLGASIPYNVIVQQRDLINAQSSETAALVTYANARIGLERTTGTLLSEYHIALAEARDARISRPPSPLPPSDRQP